MLILLLIFFGLLIYYNSLTNGFVKDDFVQIVENVKIHSIANIPQIFTGSTNETGGADRVAGIFYRPLMLSSYAVLYSIFGPAPFFFHLFQVIFHILNTLLVYLFTKRFFKNITAFMLALLFLIHPINNEAVVYIANLQEVLFFFFGMAALLLLNKNTKISFKTYTLFLFFLFLSLLSKESAILFLIITAAFSYLYCKQNFNSIFFGNLFIFGIYLFLRFGVAKMYQAQESIAEITQASLIERLIHIPAIITYYLKTFFFPIHLSADQFWFIRTLSWTNFYLPLLVSVLFLILIVIGGFYFYRKDKKLFKTYLFFSIWFLTGLLLHIQILKLDATVADRWFYFPILGLLGMIMLALQQIKIKSVYLKKISFASLVVLLLILSIRTFQRNFDWKDELTLLGKEVKVTPRNFVLDNLYATALINDDQLEKAKPYILSSIKEKPFYANLNNMAIIYLSEGNKKEAKKYLKQAVSVSRYYVVYENYSNYLLVYDNLDEAEKFTKKSLEIFPKNAKLWVSLAKIQYVKGNKKEALHSAESAYRISKSDSNKAIIEVIKNNKLKDPRIYEATKG